MTKKIFVTGTPGVGKTTILKRVAEELKQVGTKVGGIVTEEAREQNVRIGFKITDMRTGREGWLASTKRTSGPRVGKYCVDFDGLEGIGVQAIQMALEDPAVEVIIIDEVGPMELFSENFKTAVKQSIAGAKTLVGTIHYRANDPLIQEIKKNHNVRILVATTENRSSLPTQIVEEITGQRTPNWTT